MVFFVPWTLGVISEDVGRGGLGRLCGRGTGCIVEAEHMRFFT
jgi:hypothetical protein